MGFGGSVMLSQEQLDHAYVCSTNENVAFFDHLSSTSKTGYYVNDAGVSKTSICTNGIWISIKKYASSKGVSIDSLLQQQQTQPAEIANSAVRTYVCHMNTCTLV
jgi:hypothetical protein